MWLYSFNKEKYLFLTPEIALIENIKNRKVDDEAIIVVPCDMELDIKDRLRNNLPTNMSVSLLEEPYFPDEFYPGNGLIVVCGYASGSRTIVLPETYRMIEHYGSFLGKKVFIPYAHCPGSYHYNGWIEVDSGKFNAIWRGAS